MHKISDLFPGFPGHYLKFQVTRFLKVSVEPYGLLLGVLLHQNFKNQTSPTNLFILSSQQICLGPWVKNLSIGNYEGVGGSRGKQVVTIVDLQTPSITDYAYSIICYS